MPADYSRTRAILRSSSLYLGLAALFVAGALLRREFLTLANQRDVLWQVSGIGTIAIGMTLVILTAGIDLSVGSLLSLSSVVCAMLLMERDWSRASVFAVPCAAIVIGLAAGWLARAVCREIASRGGGGGTRAIGWGVGLAVTAAVGIWGVYLVPRGFGVLGVLLFVPPVGLALGALNGVIIAKGRLQPFIVTLAMMVSAVGLARYVAGFGGAVHPIYVGDATREAVAPHTFELLRSNIRIFGEEIIPVPGLIFAGSALAAWVLLNKFSVGRHIYSVGGNEEAARFSGVRTDRIKILVYAISGMLAALAAVLYCAQYYQGKADAGAMRELDAIAAVVIGGTSLMGGRGRIGGTIVGVFIFGYLSNILNLCGVSTEFQFLLKGVIIVVAVLLQEGTLARWLRSAWEAVASAKRIATRKERGMP